MGRRATIAGATRLGVAIGVASWGLLAVSPASASHVHCSDQITETVVLDSDLRGCLGNGLTVAAPNVTIYLNGHTITTKGTLGGNTFHGKGRADASVNAIHNPGFDRVRVIGPGKLAGWLSPVLFRAKPGDPMTNSVIHQVSLLDTPPNGQFGGISITGQSEAHDRLVSSVAVTSSNLGGAGVRIDHAEHVYVYDVRATRIRVQFSDDVDIVNNRVKGVGATARYWLDYGTNFYVAGNVAEGKTTKEVGPTTGFIFGALTNAVIRGNLAHRNFDGMRISGDDRNPTVNIRMEENVAVRNFDDGIDAEGVGLEDVRPPQQFSMFGNRVAKNGDWGIIAPPDTIDGGSNFGSGNGQQAQCLNVDCTGENARR